ncbi:MAG: hypothetical protein ACI8UZ_001990, partial [Akkermansiaceae bacterium]
MQIAVPFFVIAVRWVLIERVSFLVPFVKWGLMVAMKPWLFFLTASLMSAETVSDPVKWSPEARLATIKVFEREVYGINPTAEISSEWKLDRESKILDGRVDRREYVLTLAGSLKARALVYLPAGKKDVPAFLGLN